MKPKVILIFGILMILIIWTNSLLPANISSSQSGFVTSVINRVLVFFKIDLETEMLHLVIRKTAHFLEFFILGMIWILYFVKTKTNQIILKVFSIGLVVAAIDEVIQVFVPGRAFAITDIMIDLSGVFASILFLIITKNKRIISC